jgi:hypothetical protein
MKSFACDICGVTRTEAEGAGDWFSVGVNEYGTKPHRLLKIYAWPLGNNSREDDSVHHLCDVTHLLKFVKKWAGEK